MLETTARSAPCQRCTNCSRQYCTAEAHTRQQIISTYRMIEQRCHEWGIKMWTATIDFTVYLDSQKQVFRRFVEGPSRVLDKESEKETREKHLPRVSRTMYRESNGARQEIPRAIIQVHTPRLAKGTGAVSQRRLLNTFDHYREVQTMTCVAPRRSLAGHSK